MSNLGFGAMAGTLCVWGVEGVIQDDEQVDVRCKSLVPIASHDANMASHGKAVEFFVAYVFSFGSRHLAVARYMK